MFKQIKNFFKRVFSNLYKTAKKFIEEALGMVVHVVIAQLKDIAIKVVEELENTDLTDAEKREEAFRQIKEYAVLKQIEVKSSIIYLVIELALQYIKQHVQ